MPKRQSLRDHPFRQRPAPVGREAIYAPSSTSSAGAKPVAPPAAAPVSPPVGPEPASPTPQEVVAAAPPIERETKEPAPSLAPVEPGPKSDAVVAGPSRPTIIHKPAAAPSGVESPPAPGPPPEGMVIVLRCTKCGSENSSDSVFCKICGEFIIREWGAVLVKTTVPMRVTFKITPGGPEVVFRRDFYLKTSVEVTLQISGGARQDLIAFVRGPAGTIVAGSETSRIRGIGRLAWEVNEPGEYRIVLDNFFSRFSSKMVELTLSGF